MTKKKEMFALIVKASDTHGKPERLMVYNANGKDIFVTKSYVLSRYRRKFRLLKSKTKLRK